MAKRNGRLKESSGRFQRITAQEAQERMKPTPKADAFREALTDLFATIQPLEYYELKLQPKEKLALVRQRILQYAQEHNIDCVYVRAGRNNTVIVWQGRSQRGHWDWEGAVEDAPADISPGAEEGEETLQPPEARERTAAEAPAGPEGEGVEPPPPPKKKTARSKRGQR
jgi:hypothetical protein